MVNFLAFLGTHENAVHIEKAVLAFPDRITANVKIRFGIMDIPTPSVNKWKV